jgi:hypothetical protein
MILGSLVSRGALPVEAAFISINICLKLLVISCGYVETKLTQVAPAETLPSHQTVISLVIVIELNESIHALTRLPC